MTTPTLYSWSCVSGDQFTVCSLDRPACSDPLVKNTCSRGVPGNPLVDNTFVPLFRTYNWTCSLNNELKDCRISVDLC